MEIDQAVERFTHEMEKSAKERIRALCLERCDAMTCGTYEFPMGVPRADWTILVLVTVGMLILTWTGSLF